MKRTLTISMISLLLASCGGQITYKQGATPRDLEMAKKTCHSHGSSSPTDIALCLENNGWSVSQLDDMDLFAEASATDNREARTRDDENSAFVMVKKEAEPIEKIEEKIEGANNKIETKTTTDVDKTATSSAKSADTQSTTNPKTSTKKTASKDPLNIYKVSSWWKFGSSAAMLETQTNECAAELGVAHKPNYETQEVTRGLVVCLYKKGWKALKAK